MARKSRAKRVPYAITYKDSSYMIYDLTSEDFDALIEAISKKSLATLTVGLLVTDDIRAVVEQKPRPTAEPDKPAIPDVTPEELEWLRASLRGIREEEGDLQ